MSASKGEETIFAEALRLPPEERARYVAQSTQGNPELRREVESLLASYGAGCFLEQAAAPEFRTTVPITPSVTEKPGDTIGRYKLLQQIGEGGCGVVYMAEQHEPVRRRVALKIIKLGMDTKSVIARFEAERQALALMDHPNIAKVLDAGATETGRPYFVMELVRGMKITEYCDEKKLSMHERLDLFIEVCQAIQHAHQKGIIHRDIKPSNILVSVNDGVLMPKVIDFGIAKATGGQLLTNKTLFTAFEQFIGTPAYMSPEQALITNTDIDTRSDIYALGVLLYELLTGKTPFDTNELLKAGLDEMRRTIREQEPARSSTRLSTLPGQELSTTAQRRGVDAPHLVSELRGDLDWIVMKCLEKDRARRYDTANGLAADIQRHLKNEPVVACPPSRLYRLQKAVRRNKLAFAAGSAVAASLLTGLTLSTVLFFRERAARERANEERAKANEQAAIAQAVNDFLQKDLLRQADSDSQAAAGFTPDPNLTVREAVERAAERIEDRFKDQPLQEAAVRMSIGSALRGVGESERSLAHFQRALDLRRTKLGTNDPDTLRSMGALASAYRNAGKLDEALPLQEQTLKIAKARLAPDDPVTLYSLDALAFTYHQAGKYDQSVLLFEEALKLRKARPGPDHRDTLQTMVNLATAYGDAGKRDQALPLFEEALKLTKAKLGPGDTATQWAMSRLASAYRHAGKLDQALPLSEEALKLTKASRGPDHHYTLLSIVDLAEAYQDAGKPDQALPLFEDALKLRKASQGPDHPDTLELTCKLAIAYLAAGKLDQALPLSEEMLKLVKARRGMERRNTGVWMNRLAVAYAKAGKLDQALPLLEETLKLHTATLGPDHSDTWKVRYNLRTAYREAGKLAELEALLRDRLAEVRQRTTNDPPKLAGPVDDLVQVLLEQRKYAEAEQLFNEVLTAPMQNQPASAGLLRSRANLRARRGQWKEAAADLVRVREANPDARACYELAALLVASGQLDGYRELCRRSAERFSEPYAADGIARACLILPDSGVDLDVVSKMADTAVAATNHMYTPWFQLVKGMAEYRQSRFASAVEWLNKTLTETGKELERDVQAYMVLAMAHHQLKRTDEARAALAKGAEIERTKLPKLESGDIGGGWGDWIIAHALMREANALIEGTSEAK